MSGSFVFFSFHFDAQIPEYARGSDAADIVENAFQIIFAFDEIVALGHRESVTLSQIRTFTEMDSHEEKMFNAVRENQMQEARELSKRKARELELARQAAAKQGLPPSSIYNSFSTGRGIEAFGSTPSVEPSVGRSLMRVLSIIPSTTLAKLLLM